MQIKSCLKNGDKILFKKGDIFYGQIKFNILASKNKPVLISSYGDGAKPIISVAKIITNKDGWKQYSSDIYCIDLSNVNNFTGLLETDVDACNIGFFIDKNQNIYGQKKNSINNMTNLYDFYNDEKFFYIKCYNNPTEIFGKMILSTKKDIVTLSSNVEFSNISLENTSAHAIVKKSYPISNVYIHDCIINNVGGAYQYSLESGDSTRYGNAIEFWSGAENLFIEKNLIKNVYDAGITLQGTFGEWKNGIIRENIITNTCYPFELWASGTSTGMENVEIYNNIIVNQGRCWGQYVRPNQSNSANYVFYGYATNAKMNISIHNNRYYNSVRLYYLISSISDRFKTEIFNDNNTFYLQNGIHVVNSETYNTIESYLHDEYRTDINSTFNYLSDAEVEQISNSDILNSNNYDEIKSYYDKFDIIYRNTHSIENIITTLESIMSDSNYRNILQNAKIQASYEELKNAVNNLSQNIDIITADSVSYSYECLYKLINTIKDTYLNNEIDIPSNTFIELIEKLDSVSDEYEKIYSYYITEDSTTLDTVKNTLNNTIDKYNNNLDLDIGCLVNIITTAKNLYNNSITTDSISLNVLNKQRIINISNFANSIIDSKINDFVEAEKQKIKVEFDKDTDTPTNESITATLIVGNNTTIKNNGGSNKHTFESNGTFTFELDIKGVIFNVQITVSNINKEYKIEQGYITNITGNTQILDFKNNLGISNFKIDRDGETININEDIIETGDILTFNNNSYILIVSGDINSDGDCTIKDMVSYRKYLLKLSQYDNIQFKAADLNQDNELTIKDLVGIRKILLN